MKAKATAWEYIDDPVSTHIQKELDKLEERAAHYLATEDWHRAERWIEARWAMVQVYNSVCFRYEQPAER